MRVAFGLVSILVVVAIIVVLFSMTSLETARQGKQTQDELRPLTGKDDEGRPVMESISLSPVSSPSGRTNALLVTSIVGGGAMEKYFGLKANDQIIEVGTQGGMMPIRDFTDDDLAIAMVQEAYQRRLPLKVLRDGQELQLPVPANVGAETDNAPGVQSIQDQINAIRRNRGN